VGLVSTCEHTSQHKVLGDFETFRPTQSWYWVFLKLSYQLNPGIGCLLFYTYYYYYYLGAKIPEATILYNESKHNILALISKANNKDFHTHTDMETTVERKLDPYSSVANYVHTLCFAPAAISTWLIRANDNFILFVLFWSLIKLSSLSCENSQLEYVSLMWKSK
jgi:hypothetical protein